MNDLAMRQIDFLFVIHYQATKAIVLFIDTIIARYHAMLSTEKNTYWQSFNLFS